MDRLQTDMRIIASNKGSVLVLPTNTGLELASTEKALKEARRVTRELEETAANLSEAASILRSIPNAWRQRDPGKSVLCLWFIGPERQRVVVRELLPEGVEQFEGSSREWSRHIAELPYYQPFDMVPPYVKIVGFDEVWRVPCPNCANPQPLIESYQQTYDSQDYDEWQKQLLVVCCGKVHVLASESRGNRF